MEFGFFIKCVVVFYAAYQLWHFLKAIEPYRDQKPYRIVIGYACTYRWRAIISILLFLVCIHPRTAEIFWGKKSRCQCRQALNPAQIPQRLLLGAFPPGTVSQSVGLVRPKTFLLP